MKKILFLLCVTGLLSFSMPLLAKEANATAAASVEETVDVPAEVDLDQDNPIDNAFAKDFEMAQASAEISYVGEAFQEAWKAELANVASAVKKSFTNKEDGKRVDDYLADYESLAKKAFDLEMLNWISDPAEPIATRSFGTGATGAAVLAEAKIYKQAALNLVEHYQTDPEKTYSFIYKGKGADLAKLRQQN